MKKIVLLSIISSVLIFAGCNSGTDTENLSIEDSGKIVPLEDLSYDWKDINIDGGPVEYTFKLKNEGVEDLIIKSATTSCMCTSATISLQDGSQSQKFGMHGDGSWGGAVKPGEEFEVLVVFDPMAHGPDAVGPITRSIYLETSSKANGNYAKYDKRTKSMVTEIEVMGDVLYGKEYESKKSAFFFPEVEYDFGKIKQSGGIVNYNFEFEYTGDDPITVTSTPTSCACTTAEISQETFSKGEKGILTVNFDPNLHEEPKGVFFKTITILTDPKLEEQPEVKIWTEIDLDLGPEAYKLKEDHDDADEHSDGIAYHNITAKELTHMLDNKDFFMVDVHIPEQEHIEGTDALVPYDQIAANIDKLPEDKSTELVIYCRSGSMSTAASKELADLGYTNVKNLVGGRNAYLKLTE